VPLPWSGTAPSFGFGPTRESWLPQPAAWADLTAERQDGDPGSMLNLYREALRRRRDTPALGDGTLTWLPGGDDMLAFRREPGFICVVNVGDKPAAVPEAVRDATLVLASGPIDDGDMLPAATGAWYRTG
jgi:alpha-glucosidase